MRLIALMPVRNEAWILGLSLRAALRWCDGVVCLDHASTDATPAILEAAQAEFKGRVDVIREDDPAWSEMAHRQRLLDAGRTARGTHFAIVDADEVLTGNLLERIRGIIESLGAGRSLSVGMPCMWRSLDAVRTDGCIWSRREDLVLAFGASPNLHWSANGYDHHHRHPYGSAPQRRLGYAAGGVMHLQWSSWRRLVAKHARYKMMERLKYPAKSIGEIDRMYSLALNEAGLTTMQAPDEWWRPYRNLMHHVDLDAVPWQEAECERMWSAFGAQMFKGLDLFGVVA